MEIPIYFHRGAPLTFISDSACHPDIVMSSRFEDTGHEERATLVGLG